MSKKILLIEDHTDLRTTTGELLELFGYTVSLAENGLLGLAMALKELPDLIMSDLRMPGMDGYELITRLQENEQTRHIPLIITSANFDGADSMANRPNVIAFLTKPYDVDELLGCLAAVLR